MLNVRGTWVGKMALFGGSQYAPMILGMSLRPLEAIDRYGSSNCFEVSMAYRGPALFFRGWNKSILYMSIYLMHCINQIHITICLTMFEEFWKDFLDFVSPSFESTTDQWRLGVFEEVPSLNASTEHDEWMRKVGSIKVRELRNNGKSLEICCR